MTLRIWRGATKLTLEQYEIPTSALQKNGKRIKYYDFISSGEYMGCNAALRRIVPAVEMEQIYGIIDDTPLLSSLQRSFYKNMLSERKRVLLDQFVE